jgi:hypothetical protein
VLAKHPHVWLGYGGAAGRFPLSAHLAALASLKACPSPSECGVPLTFGQVTSSAAECGAPRTLCSSGASVGLSVLPGLCLALPGRAAGGPDAFQKGWQWLPAGPASARHALVTWQPCRASRTAALLWGRLQGRC